MKNQNRREFIIDSAKIAGAAIGTATLGHGFLLPKVSEAATVKFPESNCGAENKNSHKILVTYASQCGSTGEVAEAVGKVLCQGGAIVEIKWIKTVNNLDDYDVVIIGSAIQKSQWMSEATEFVTSNQYTLSKLPVAFFLTCLTLSIHTEKARSKAMKFLDPLYAAAPQVKPISVGHFAGVLDYSKMSFMYRTIMKRKMKKWGIQEGDYRDWDEIQSWAKSIPFNI